MRRLQFRLGLAMLVLFFSSAVAQADTWLLDFGPSTQTTTPNYNNITNNGVHSFPGLVNSTGQITNAALAITIPFNISSMNTNGTLTPAPEVEFLANATRDSFYGNVVVFQNRTAPNAQLVLSGLDPALLYDFTFFASRMGVTDNRQTEYKISGVNVQTAYLNPSDNTSRVATVAGVQPTPGGTIVLDLQPGPENVNANKFYYLGAMKVVSRAPPPTTCASDDPLLDDKLTSHAYVAGVSPYVLGHWLYRPAGYSLAPCKKYPLLVWLHGAGERCPSPLSALNTAGLNSPGYQIQTGTAYTDQRPFLNGFILQPQTCDGSWTGNSIDAMIEYAKSKYRIDSDRIYVTGLSLGAGGAWTYAGAYYGKVAAIVPIAGTEKSLSNINSASHVPTWAFHNYNDTNVGWGLNPEGSLFRCKSHTHRLCTIEHIDRMIPFATTYVMKDYSADGGATMASTDRTASLVFENEILPTKWLWESSDHPLSTPSKTILTIYAKSGHSGWTTAYGSRDMWAWLYSQKREPTPSLWINVPTIAPLTAGVGSGAIVKVTAKVAVGGVPFSQLWVDLKHLGGSNATRMNYVSATGTYEVEHTLPLSGLTPGTKGIGIVAIDQNGNRTVRYVTITLQ
jgi:hypothetical protein